MATRTNVGAAAAEGATTGAGSPAAARRPILGHIPGFRARVAECNEITPEDIARYVPLVVAGVPVGLMQEFFAEARRRNGEHTSAVVRRPFMSFSSPPPPHARSRVSLVFIMNV